MATISLKGAQTRLAETVEPTETRLSQEAYDQVFGPFGRGEFRELTDPEWKALVEGKRKFLSDPQSFALPPRRLVG
ncbi:MAG: hypothetical protein WAM82_35040 [Thermoanaerobaculia bacterium]